MNRMMLRRRVLMASLMNSGLPLSDLPEGSLVAINESGSPVLFYLAKHDYESGLNGAGRTLFVRKDCYDERKWNSNNANAYASSTIDSWLNGDYKSLLSSKVQSEIGTIKFYSTIGNGDYTVTTLERSIFMLSVTELGLSKTGAKVEGTALAIASTLRIAYKDGSAIEYWTRTPYSTNSTFAFYINTSGKTYSTNVIDGNGHPFLKGSRPCFTLPSTATVNQQPNADGSYTLTI